MQIDHLIYGVPDLDRALDSLEQKFGIRPQPGGRHPDYGTRNALLSLGPGTYLEVMACDRSATPPARGILFDLDQILRPRLITWVLRTPDIDSARSRLDPAGELLGPIQRGSRVNEDRSVLSWQLTDPYAFPFDGMFPFLIDWGDTPHPASSAPVAGRLSHLTICHPQAAYLDTLPGIEVVGQTQIRFSDTRGVMLTAEIETKTKSVTL